MNSTISKNKAVHDGGGIDNDGKTILTKSTVTGNFAGEGGGIYTGFNATELTLVNSTISSNTSCDLGGGIFSNWKVKMDVYNSTITGNVAKAGAVNPTCQNFGNKPSGTGGGIFNYESPINLYNTIISQNKVHINGRSELLDDDCSEPLGELSYGLLTTISGCTFTNDNSITGQNPELGPLAENGGPTLMHALEEDSPAVDAGNPKGCKDQDGKLLRTDQRGEARPQDGDLNGSQICDIGAYELPVDFIYGGYLPFVYR